MAKKTENITIPMHLAKILAAEPEDYKEPSDYEEVNQVAKILLRLLIGSK